MKFIDIDDSFLLLDILTERFEESQDREDFIRALKIENNIIHYKSGIIAFSVQGDEVFYSSEANASDTSKFKDLIEDNEGVIDDLIRPLELKENFEPSIMEGIYYMKNGTIYLFK